MKNARLFWTGGWDSTFQLLQLLLIYDCEVTPFYLIDSKRPSTGNELFAMTKMKKYLFKEFPRTKELLKPTRYYSTEDVKPDDLIEASFKKVRLKTHLGEQYNWMARVCKELGINDMNLSMEKAVKPSENHTFYRLKQKMDIKVVNGQEVYQISKELEGEDVYNIIQYFYFPILDLTKFDMVQIAEKNGWMKVLSMTWFCFYPTRNNQPCGTCIPCQQRIKEGFMWNFPLRRRIIFYQYRNVIWPLKSFVKTGLLKFGLR